MKYELPNNHGLSEHTLRQLVFLDNGRHALSDAQYDALNAGVGRGESALIVSPTSTGKTHIALWAIARSLEQGCHTVYLVTHRALAKQKFEDFKSQLLSPYLGDNLASLVVATGDYVEDAEGQVPAEPLGVPLLIATYEKYLALLSASGIPADMRSTVVVCDEIQLLGDANRGQSVEVLLTLIRNAGFRQFVGLSAVLQPKDAGDLANWLGVRLVIQHTREKHLRYECWSPHGMAVASSAHPDRIDEGIALPAGADRNPVSLLMALLREPRPPLPVIVFCMTKKEPYDLANRFVELAKRGVKGQLSLAFDGLPETSANTFLAGILEHRVAIHTADLTDEERHVVEHHLLHGKLDVVFATSTLAAGVNFPLGAAIFASWARWDSDTRTRIPIESGEFHNMAGRVGRMGFAHDHGRVMFFADDDMQVRAARQYLQLGELPSIEPRVTPERFNQLALQLVASSLCPSRSEIERLVCNTFSALREQDRNAAGFSRWPRSLSNAVDSLLAAGLLVETSSGRLSATPVGKAIGNSGLLPETGIFLLEYIVSKAERLVGCLPTYDTSGDMPRMAFLLFSACLSSPEFRPQAGVRPTRYLPWPLERHTLFDAEVYREDLVEPVWHADLLPINSAKLCRDWMDGAELKTLEASVPQLSAGMLRELFRNLCWTMQGLASILTAAADARVPPAGRPPVLRAPETKLDAIAKLPRVLRRLSYRISEGLPDNVLWMTGLNSLDSEFRVTRTEILALQRAGYSTPEQVMLGSNEADAARVAVFAKIKPAPQAKANWLRDTCRQWKANHRERTAQRHLKRVHRCGRPELVKTYYAATGTDFEKAFEEILAFLNIPFEKLDDKKKTGAPDYLLTLKDSGPLVVELKSREGEKLVDYNKSVEVLAASEVHGHKDTFCVTLCHPGVDPSVPMVIAACGRLSVVESSDLGEAFIRLCEGSLTQYQLWQWLASPGQALASDLPFKDYA
jgi:helicase